MKEKKIGFFSVTCLAIGTIVGAGVFGTIPAAAGIVAVSYTHLNVSELQQRFYGL